MKLKYQVSFESDEKLETIKGTSSGTTYRAVVGRALNKAIKDRKKGFVWTSVVICLWKEN